MNKLGTVTLESERLILRKCVESDYKDSYKYCCSDPELCRLQGFDVHKSDETTKRSFKEKEERYKVDNMFYEWAIVRKEDNQFMGEIALVHYNETNNEIELGYHIGKAFRGQGYMQEALDAILKFAFEYVNIGRVDKILDIGCGNGVNIEKFLKITSKNINDLDYSEISIKETENLLSIDSRG